MASDEATRRDLLVDLVGIVVIAAVLVAVHLAVPAGVRDGFALRFAHPDPLHALTAAYVHLNRAHLRGNVLGFLVAGLTAVLIANVTGEERWFRLSVLALVTVLPMADGMTTALVIGGNAVGRGFSGVVAGFAGFVLVGAAVVLVRVFDVERSLAWDVLAVLSLVVAGEIIWAQTGQVPLAVGGLLLVGIAAALWPLAGAARNGGWSADRAAASRVGAAALSTALLFAVVSWFVVGLFPHVLVSDGTVTNVLAHYLGLVFGVVIALWGYRYWGTAAPVVWGGPAPRGDPNRGS